MIFSLAKGFNFFVTDGMWTRLLLQQRFMTLLSLSNVSKIPKVIGSNLLKVATASMSSSPTPPPDEPPKTRVPIVLLESDLEERFIKGGGAGGQKINKTASAVQLVHLPTGLPAVPGPRR